MATPFPQRDLHSLTDQNALKSASSLVAPSPTAVDAAAPTGSRLEEALADALGTLGLYVFAFSAWLSPPLNAWAGGLCLAALLLSPAARAWLARSVPVRVAVVCMAFLVFETLRGIRLLPGSEAIQFASLQYWLQLPGFLAVAWWLQADRSRILTVLLAALLGRLFGLFAAADWRDILGFHADAQTGFNLLANHSALVAASALLGLILAFPHLLRESRGSRRRHRLIAAALGAYLSVYLLIVSQSRTTWLAFVLILGGILVWRRCRARPAGEDSPRHGYSLWLLAALLGILGAVGVARNAHTIADRLSHDVEATASLLARGDAQPDPRSSLSTRFQLQKFAIDKWREQPLLGWGTGASQPLIERSGRQELFMPHSAGWLRQMHNGYLEILVRLGLAGLGFLGVVVWGAFRSVTLAWRQGRIGEDQWLFLTALLALQMIWLLTSPLNSREWFSYWTILMGVCYTYAVHGAAQHPRVSP